MHRWCHGWAAAITLCAAAIAVEAQTAAPTAAPTPAPTCAPGTYRYPDCLPGAFVVMRLDTAAEAGAEYDESFYGDAAAVEKLRLVVATELQAYVAAPNANGVPRCGDDGGGLTVLNATAPQAADPTAGPVLTTVVAVLRPTAAAAMATAQCVAALFGAVGALPQVNLYGRAEFSKWLTLRSVATTVTARSPCGRTVCTRTALVIPALTPKPKFQSTAFFDPSYAAGAVVTFAVIGCFVTICAARRMRMMTLALAAAEAPVLPPNTELHLTESFLSGAVVVDVAPLGGAAGKGASLL
jgi:hypothetical protein